MRKTNDNNCNFDYADLCVETLNSRNNDCCPKVINNHIIVRGATGTSDIVGISIVTTTEIDSVLTVRNPAGNSTALTITPLAGGTRPVSAHLVITQINNLTIY